VSSFKLCTTIRLYNVYFYAAASVKKIKNKRVTLTSLSILRYGVSLYIFDTVVNGLRQIKSNIIKFKRVYRDTSSDETNEFLRDLIAEKLKDTLDKTP
jgi:ferritin